MERRGFNPALPVASSDAFLCAVLSAACSRRSADHHPLLPGYKSLLTPRARRIASPTETKLSTSPRPTQAALESFQTSKTEVSVAELRVGDKAEDDGPEFPRATNVTTATQRAASAKAAPEIPGNARFHGNGIGGGTAASHRTEPITASTKPDAGAMSCSLERMRSRSSCFTTPPFLRARPPAHSIVSSAVFHAHERASPLRFLPVAPGCAPPREYPSRENKKEVRLLYTSAAASPPRAAPRDLDFPPPGRRPQDEDPAVRAPRPAQPFALESCAVRSSKGSSPK